MSQAPFRISPYSRLSGFGQQVMDDVAQQAGTESIDRSTYPYYVFDCTAYDTGIPPSLPCMWWKPGTAHFDRSYREVGSPAPNPVSGTIGSWMTPFHIKVMGNTPAEAYDELNLYLMPALEHQFPIPPIRDHVMEWAPEDAEHNGKSTILLTFVVPIKVDEPPPGLVTVTSASYHLTDIPGSTFASTGSFRRRVITSST